MQLLDMLRLLFSYDVCVPFLTVDSSEEDGLVGVDVELSLSRDEVCSILSPKPALQSQKDAAASDTAIGKRESVSTGPALPITACMASVYVMCCDVCICSSSRRRRHEQSE